MEWLNKYWKIITSLVFLVLAAGALQAQVAVNQANISANKTEHNKSDAAIILLVQKETTELKLKTEKEATEAKKERDAIKLEQRKQTEIRINQKYMREDMQELKQGFKEILNELRESKK